MSQGTDFHTALGRYTVHPWRGDNRVQVQPVDAVTGEGYAQLHSWDPVMEGALRAAARSVRARVEMVLPGGFRVHGSDDDLASVIERMVKRAGGLVDGEADQPGAASNRARAVAAARLIYDRLGGSRALHGAVDAGEGVCNRRGGLRGWDLAIRDAGEAAANEAEARAVKILQAARSLRHHDAARRARRILVSLGHELAPEAPDPMTSILAWWDALPEAGPMG